MSFLKDAEKTKVSFGSCYIIQNPLTQDWFVYAGKEVFITGSKSEASKLAKELDKK